jgi:acyl-CoA thioester hydrolase
MLDGYKHRTPVTVRFADLDATGYVNHARYQSYMETARARYYTDLELWDGRPGGIGPIMAKVVVEYHLPLTLGDEIVVYSRCARLGSKSYDMEHIIARCNDNQAEAAVHARVTVVMYDHRNGHSVALPDHWRRNVSAYEGMSNEG